MNMINNPGVMASNCVPQEMSLNNVKLAHAYVPFQRMCTNFPPLTGLRKGTIFPPLYDEYRWEKKRGCPKYE